MFLKILSKMYLRLHYRGPEYSPDHHDDGDIRCEGVGLVKKVHTFFLRRAQARYSTQGSGRSAGGSARDKR